LSDNTHYYIIADNRTLSSSTHTLELLCPGYGGACNNVSILECETPESNTFFGYGAFNAQFCGVVAPNAEEIYTFVPNTTGEYLLEVSSVSGGEMHYLYKLASNGCNVGGWNC